MWPQPGRALLALAVPGNVLLFLFLGAPVAGWALGLLALLLCREDWDLRPGVPAALVAFGAFLVLAIAGLSLTIGTSAGPVASVGESFDVAPLETGGFLAVVASAAVLLAGASDMPVRRLGQAAAVLLALPVLADLTAPEFSGARLEYGSLVLQAEVLLVLAFAAHAAVLAGLAVAPFRDAVALARRLAGREAPG